MVKVVTVFSLGAAFGLEVVLFARVADYDQAAGGKADLQFVPGITANTQTMNRPAEKITKKKTAGSRVAVNIAQD